MSKLLFNWRRSEALSADKFKQMCEQARVLEQDERGIKVLQLADGNIFKLFRVRRLLSLAHIYSYARHFCRNADGLAALGIPTVSIIKLMHFVDGSDTAVLYQPLSGKTLRQLSQAGELGEGLMRDFGEFVARLHAMGVYFRSLHFGNVVLTPEGTLGLIDIADLKLYGRGLSTWHRGRNFRHLQRLKDDWKIVLPQHVKAFAEAYFEMSGLTPDAVAALRPKLKYLP
ncbi:BUD32 family EKC/KEOPS complex subunit [Methylovorus mays]|uniref:toluene tolerance protein n=1 Tax=Methylovorus mays TaxID=184077 RepID=UPI001E3152C6|nr:toluene tolerance protein [Methylovorus mays]MCB5206944.1 toluene tolerance protein [Methylovorus mays]